MEKNSLSSASQFPDMTSTFPNAFRQNTTSNVLFPSSKTNTNLHHCSSLHEINSPNPEILSQTLLISLILCRLVELVIAHQGI